MTTFQTMDIAEQLHYSGLLPYTSSPANDLFMFSFLTTYLMVVKQFSVEKIRDYTTYDFINLKWSLTEVEAQLFKIYFQLIRVKWIGLTASKSEDLTTLQASPCGLYVSVTSKFFVNHLGVSADWNVDKGIAEDLLNKNTLRRSQFEEVAMMTTRSRRERRLSVSAMRNCQDVKQSVYEKCMLQQWGDVEVNEECPGGRGRGIVATRFFHKNNIIVDYHARVISKEEKNGILEDNRSNYLFCGPSGLYWDGSSESCICHPQSRLLGRLANFAKKDTLECNVKPQLFEYKLTSKSTRVFHTIIIVAIRDIAPMEELRYDYGDRVCLELFV